MKLKQIMSPFAKLRQELTSASKPKKIALIAAVAIVIAAGAGATWWFNRATPEETLYSAIVQSNAYGISVEKNTTGDSRINVAGLVKKDGTYKLDGTLSCKAPIANYGNLVMSIGIRQVQYEVYARFNAIGLQNTGNSLAQMQINNYLQGKLVNKWLQVDDNDAYARALKEYGLALGSTSITSSKFSGQQIADLFKQHQVFTILSVKNVKYNGRSAAQYDLVVRRAAYSSVVDSIQPHFKYKDQLLDSIFNKDATTKSTLTVDKATGQVVSGTDSIANPCVDFMKSFSPDDAQKLPSKLVVTYSSKAGSDLPQATKPTYFFSGDQARAILNGN